MGNCASSSNPDSSRSKQIDKQIKMDEKKAKTEVKLLLLGKSKSCSQPCNAPTLAVFNFLVWVGCSGAGESGKSTVLKQMRLIHAAGFSASEKEAYRIVIFDNIVSSMQTMLEAMDILKIEMENQNNMVSAQISTIAPTVLPSKRIYLGKQLSMAG
jgi:guanine nucleotide-binding protein subunit alpha